MHVQFASLYPLVPPLIAVAPPTGTASDAMHEQEHTFGKGMESLDAMEAKLAAMEDELEEDERGGGGGEVNKKGLLDLM